MESRGGSRDRARLAGEDRLVALGVRGLGRAIEVGRQGQLAMGLGQRERVGRAEIDRQPALGSDRRDADHASGNLEPLTFAEPLRGIAERQPMAITQRTIEEDFDLAARVCLSTPQARVDHPRVVEDQEVTRRESSSGSCRNIACSKGPLSARHEQQASPIPLSSRLAGDELIREWVVKVREAHADESRTCRGRKVSTPSLHPELAAST